MDPKLYQAVNKARLAVMQSKKTFVIIEENKVAHHTGARGLKPFLDLLDKNPAKLAGAVIGDRIVGRASAFLCIYAKVKAVFALHISEDALDLLERHGCVAAWTETVPYIVEHDLSSKCKLDLILENVEKPADALKLIREYVEVQSGSI